MQNVVCHVVRRKSSAIKFDIVSTKTVQQGTVQGGRRRGRQRKQWEDNIKEWTGLEWNIMLQKAEKREEWRKLVVKFTVVPQRLARLLDRQEIKKV